MRHIIKLQLLTIFVLLLVACDSATNQGSGSQQKSSKITSTMTDNDQTAAAYREVPDSIEVVEAPLTGVSIGWGWNKSVSEPIPTICVEFVEGEERAQTRFMTMEEVTDSYEAMQAMDMSAEASVKTIAFEASGKASFAKSLKINSESNTFIMNAEVHNGVRFAAPMPKTDRGVLDDSRLTYRGGQTGKIELTPFALSLANRNNRDDFKAICGTGFVSAIYGGAKLTAVITTTASTRAEKSTSSASMSGGGWGARFEGNINSTTDSALASSSVSLSMFQTGGSGDAIPVSKEDLLEKMKVLSLEAYNSPKDFSLAITPYEILSNWPGTSMQDRETEFDELASYWGAYKTLYDEIQRILDNPGDYAGVNIGEFGCVDVVNTNEEPTPINRKAVADLHKRYQQDLQRIMASGNFKNIMPIATRFMEELEALSKPPATVIYPDNADNLAQLRIAQDEILFGLRKLQDIALDCVSKSDTCNFNAKDYRSPYAYRLQLLPKLGFVDNTAELISLFVDSTSKSRCRVSPDNAGCISNHEIDQWHHRVGLTSLTESQDKAFYQKLLKLIADEESQERIVCEDGQRSAPLISKEKGGDVIWYNATATQDTL